MTGGATSGAGTTAGAELNRALPTTVLFRIGSMELDDVAKEALDRFGEALAREHPRGLLIIGRANEHPTLDTNLELGERRAQAVSRHLSRYGLDGIRVAVSGSEGPKEEDGGRSCEVEPVW